MSEGLPAALAIDGGNSKTDVALVARDGSLLALVRGPGMPVRLGDETVQVIDELIRSAVKLAGQEADQTGTEVRPTHGSRTGLVASHLVGCVANVDLPAEERKLERMLSDQGWTSTTVVANDTLRCSAQAWTTCLPRGRSGTGVSALPAARGSTASAWRRTGAPPASSRLA